MHDRTANTPARRPARSAFTLIELLVVIGIIVLIIAFAMPAFRFMSGSRSTEAAQNQLAAMLGTARSEALGVQQPRGIIVYRDIASDRLAANLIETRTTASVVGFVAGTTANPIDHAVGEYVSQSSKAYVCVQNYTDDGTFVTPATDTTSAYWRQIDGASLPLPNGARVAIEAVPDSDRVMLPAGVDLRGAGDSTVNGISYRYQLPCVILFDGKGQLSVQDYRILRGFDTSGNWRDGFLASQMERTNTSIVGGVDTAATIDPNPYIAAKSIANIDASSQIGFTLFDYDQFKSRPTPTPSEYDWIETYGIPVLVNRYNGTLTRGQ